MKTRAPFAMIGWIVACCSIEAALVPLCVAAPDTRAAIKEIITQHERAALEAFKTHDKQSFTKLCRPDFYEITSGGAINTLRDELAELDDYVLGEYQMDDVLVTVLSDTVALIRYRIAAQYFYKGKQLPVEPILASAVWIKSGSDWRAATYQEVEIAERK